MNANESSEIRGLKADELDEVTGGGLGNVLDALATSVAIYNMGLGWIPPSQFL
jgi:hypothetical protein